MRTNYLDRSNELRSRPGGRRRRHAGGRDAVGKAAGCVIEALEDRRLMAVVRPDLTFGTAGFASLLFPGSTNDAANAVAVTQADGKILVAGAEADSNEHIEVARLTADGTLDTTFGNRGLVALQYGTICRADSIAVQPDGKILVGGAFNGQSGRQSVNGFPIDGYVGVVRLNGDGTLDTRFGTDGLAVSDQVFVGDTAVRHLVLQPDGKIVAAGEIDGNYLDFALTRFTSDGRVDPTFGTSGVSSVDFGRIDPASDITTDPSGDLIVAGTITPQDNLEERDLGIARFTPDGALDSTFGIGGTVIVKPAASNPGIGVQSVVVDTAGDILLGGATQNAVTGYDFSLVRLTSGGALDASFGSGGRVTTDVTGGGYFDAIDSLVLLPSGRVLAAGQGSLNFAVVQYNPDGSIDSSFNDTGIYAQGQPDYGATSEAASPDTSALGPAAAVALQPDGDILAVGTWRPNLTAMYVTRLTQRPPVVDFSAGFSNPATMTLTGPATVSGAAVQLSGGPAASAWTSARVDATYFVTTFDFRSTAGDTGGFTFSINGDSPAAPGGNPDRLVSVLFDLATNNTTTYVNGRETQPLADQSTGLSLGNGDVYRVTLAYDVHNSGPMLAETITDLTNPGAYHVFDSMHLDIPAITGGAAYVGFTTSGGSQSVLSWTYDAPPLGDKPLAPSGILGDQFPDHITLHWTDNSDNETGFLIESDRGDEDFDPVAVVPAGVTSYTDIVPTNPGIYHIYRVRAFNAAGFSVGSTSTGLPAAVTPAAPTNATATAVSPDQVDLTWQDNTGSLDPTYIYRRIGGAGDFTLLAVVHWGLTSYADTNAPSGQFIEYRIASGLRPDSFQFAESAPASASTITPSTANDVSGPTLVFNGSAHLDHGSLALTDATSTGAQTGSAWAVDYQDVHTFSTSFSFRFANADAGGITFSLLGNNPQVWDGHTAIGSNQALGFGEEQLLFARATGIQFYLGGPAGAGGGATGLLQFNGESPAPYDSINVTSAGINFGSGHTFDVTLTYQRYVLTETITDTSTNATFQHTYFAHDLPADGGVDLVGFTGAKPAGSGQSVAIDSWAYSSPSSPAPVAILSPNTAPILTSANDFPTITEDNIDVGNVALQAGDLTQGHVADPLNPNITATGIAITSLDSGNGTWQYQDNVNYAWHDIGPVSDASALLLGPADYIRFVPNGKNGTAASLTFRAWDGRNGPDLHFTKQDVSALDAYSADTATTHITVTDVNDSPTLNGANDFPVITEDDVDNAGQRVSDVIAGFASDVDTNSSALGVAVIGATESAGIWQYSLDDGTTWTNLGPVSPTSATLLGPDARLRSVPNGQYGTSSTFAGVERLTLSAWDQSDGLPSGTTGVNTATANPKSTGGVAATTLFISDVNDAPILTGTGNFPGIFANDRDNGGRTPGDFASPFISDVDLLAPYTGNVHNTRTIAITGDTGPGTGTWQYLSGDAVWTDIGPVSDTSALLMDPGTAIRFRPDGVHGGDATLTFRAWDGSNGFVDTRLTRADVSVNGGTTPYSIRIATAHLAVTPLQATTSLSLAAAGPYGGTATLSATLLANGAPLPGAVVTFAKADGSPVGSAITDASGTAILAGVGIAGLDVGTQGDFYRASFAGDARDLPSTATGPLVVINAPAQVAYTGDTLVTADAGGVATINLRADLRDLTGGTGGTGDIRNATVTFRIFNASGGRLPIAVIAGSPVGLVDPSDDKAGSSTATWTRTLTSDSQIFKVVVVVDHDYVGSTTGSPDLVTAAVPSGGSVTGGGYLTESASGGAYAADAGSRTDFGFTAGDASGTPKGNVNVIFRRTAADGTVHTYQIQSTAILSFGKDTTTGRANVLASATLTDLTTSTLIAQDLTLQLTLSDAGEPGTYDALGLSLWNADALLFSSDWTGLQTVQQAIAGGNLQVH